MAANIKTNKLQQCRDPDPCVLRLTRIHGKEILMVVRMNRICVPIKKNNIPYLYKQKLRDL